ncbi:hypothetical protein GCM10008949_28660 [Deinococcus humi]|nr:hypothetical protein GCM10008949_28660 [Deinococcus humi]
MTGSGKPVVPTLSEAVDINESGSVVGNYVLEACNEDVILGSNTPEVDRIVLATLFEKIRCEAYLSNPEGEPLTDARVDSMTKTLAGKLSFRVCSHSLFAVEDEEEQ